MFGVTNSGSMYIMQCLLGFANHWQIPPHSKHHLSTNKTCWLRILPGDQSALNSYTSVLDLPTNWNTDRKIKYDNIYLIWNMTHFQWWNCLSLHNIIWFLNLLDQSNKWMCYCSSPYIYIGKHQYLLNMHCLGALKYEGFMEMASIFNAFSWLMKIVCVWLKFQTLFTGSLTHICITMPQCVQPETGKTFQE